MRNVDVTECRMYKYTYYYHMYKYTYICCWGVYIHKYIPFVVIRLWLSRFKQLEERFSWDLQFSEFIWMAFVLVLISISWSPPKNILLSFYFKKCFLSRYFTRFCSPECFLWIAMDTCIYIYVSQCMLFVFSLAQLYLNKNSVRHTSDKRKLHTLGGSIISTIRETV